MVVDFQHHYTPPELMERGGAGILRLDENGNPNYKFNPLLADLTAHVRMMDRAGIDLAVLSCGSGFDQPDIATCRLINDRMRQAERDYSGRFVGLAHVPALDPQTAAAELKRCAVELGFPGVVIASELQGQALDAEVLRCTTALLPKADVHPRSCFVANVPKPAVSKRSKQRSYSITSSARASSAHSRRSPARIWSAPRV